MPTVSTPATLEDVRQGFERSLSADEERVIPKWLDRAWGILAVTVPGLDARLGAGDVDAELVRDTVVAMVERKLRNPDGLRSYGGDGDQAVVDQVLSSGQLAPTVEEVARLTPPVARSGGFFSIPLGRG